MHSKQLAHGDLKAANVLVHDNSDDNSDWTFWLCDIGNTHNQITTKLASTINQNRQAVRGTVAFDAPEVFLQSKKDMKSDIYAYAMVMHEILHGHLQHPWASDFSVGSSESISSLIIDAVKNGRRPKVEEREETLTLCTLLQKAWHQEPDQRPSAEYIRIAIEKLVVTFLLH